MISWRCFFDPKLSYDNRVVGRFDKGKLSVSTAWVNDGLKEFETAIMHPAYNDGQWVIVESYESTEEAKAGHDRWVTKMTTKPLPEELTDICNTELSKLIEEMNGKPVVHPKKGKA